MIKSITIIFLVFVSLGQFASAQGGESSGGKEIIDTIDTGQSKILLFADKTWSFIEDESAFNGILNEHVHSLVSDTSMNFKATWYTDMPFAYDNDIEKLTDTLWLCTVDEGYNEFCIPVKGAIVSKFKYRGSRFHHGLDIDLDVGDTVLAAFTGKVRYAQYNKGGFGNLVIIRHYNGLETYYAHLSQISVESGQEVTAGDLIGLGGKTGRAYGPHLHFETRFYDHAFDPYEIIDFDTYTLKDSNLLIHPGMFDYKAVSKKNTTKIIPALTEDGNTDNSATNTVEKVNTNTVKATNTTSGSKKYHKVKSGDTLSGIATKNGTTVSKLCELNGISRTSVIQIGQSIRIK
jgi:murein DD-endopeptidase MepM/ murein hydrolase activator NlpD